MQIGWVGGLNRSETYLTSMATAAGHKLEFHNGDVRGNGFKGLRRLVNRSSFVIILITINSHQGVQLTKRLAHKHNCPSIVMQRCGRSSFRQLLAAINQPDSKL